MKVLVVDDNPDSRLILKKTLEHNGYEVAAASNGAEALKLSRDFRPDMIISDILMPVMDGFMLCREVKKDSLLKKIPFVFYSATYVDPEDERLAMSLGASRYILKPVETERFLEIIGDVFREYEEDRLPVLEEPVADDPEIARMHGESLVRKLYEKSRELEEERKALFAAKELLRSVLDNIGVGISLMNRDMEVLLLNRQMLNWFPGVDVSSKPLCYEVFKSPPAKGLCEDCPVRRTFKDGGYHELFSAMEIDGETRYFRISSSPARDEKDAVVGAVTMMEDITMVRRAEEEKRVIQSQLFQSQKLESIGRLASGVAHDFNNLLTAILGYTEMSINGLPLTHPVQEHLKVIKSAGGKAASLTRQLLAFSRKQVLEVKVITLNDIIEQMGKMLVRLIGEDIRLEMRLQRPIRNIKADPAQIEHVLMNLVVNARDAMPCGGSLIIETADTELDADYMKAHTGVKAGPYVMLTVTDTGEGMTGEVREKVFEPFFTTKEAGKGTGLGLSTVYGIVKQHDGYIWVYSEPGKGTSIKIYFPATAEPAEEWSDRSEASLSRGRETVLVVEDEPYIRQLVVDTLQPLGYRVIEASCGSEALRVADAEGLDVDLLLTDVIMPGMNGKELADLFRSRNPGTKVVFMSGYSDVYLSHSGILDAGVTFIHKPLTPSTLVTTLRKTLDEDGA